MEPIGSGTGSQEVEVAFAGPEQQRRLTVAFRILLLIPHGIVLFFLGIAVEVVAIVGWFAALILGRLPDGIANFISGVVRYTARVYAYGYLLTDRYPPFSLAPEDYAVAVTTHPGRLNRLAVLFRFILMIPAYIVLGLLGSGLSIVMFFTWLIVLVAGRMPPALHQAVAAVLRYQVRYYSYLALISSTYPSRLFGDPPSAPAEPPGYPLGPTPAEPPPPGTPFGAPPAEPPFGAPPAGAPFAPPPAAGAPLATRLVLTTAAKRILVVMLVIGVLSLAGSSAVAAVTAGSAGRIETFNTLDDDYSQLGQAVHLFESQAAGCSSAAGLSCAQSAARQLGAAFSVFGQDVQGLDVPAVDQGDADQLVNDAQQLAGLLGRMATAPTQTDYENLAHQFQSLAPTFDSDYQKLGQDLLTG